MTTTTYAIRIPVQVFPDGDIAKDGILDDAILLHEEARNAREAVTLMTIRLKGALGPLPGGVTEGQELEAGNQIIELFAITIQTAQEYIAALEEELGHQGTDALNGKALAKKWEDAQANLKLAFQGKFPKKVEASSETKTGRASDQGHDGYTG